MQIDPRDITICIEDEGLRDTPGAPLSSRRGERLRGWPAGAIGAFMGLVAVMGGCAGESEPGTAASCADCEIVFLDSIRLQPPDSVTFNFAEITSVTRDSGGRHFVAGIFTPGAFAVFDESGRFERTVGRLGEGPGEFSRPRWVGVGPGDSLWVFQNGSRDVSLLDPDFGFVRRTLLLEQPPSVEGVVPLADGRMAMGELFRSTDEEVESGILTRTPGALVLGVDGRRLDAFGQREGARPLSALAAMSTVAASTDPNHFWLWSFVTYRLERWTADGTRLLVVEPDEPRFVDLEAGESGVVWNVVDGGDVLWVWLRLAPSFRDPDRPQLLQAIDPDSGRVLAELALAQTPNLIAGGFVRLSDEDAEGLHRVTVARLGLRGSG